jgi:hypothetical protein
VRLLPAAVLAVPCIDSDDGLVDHGERRIEFDDTGCGTDVSIRTGGWIGTEVA